MAATRINLTEVAQAYLAESATPQLTATTGTGADTVNGNIISLNQGDVLLVFENTDAAPQTVNITSYPTPYGRLASISGESIAAGAFAMRFFKRNGWGNGNGDLELTASDAGVLITAVKL